MSKIDKIEWVILFVLSGIVDIIQFAIDFIPPIGESINAVADPIIGAILAIYFQIRGVSLVQRIGRLVSILGVTFVGELTGGIASFWIVDVWYIYRSVKAEESEAQSQEEINSQNINAMRNPAVQNGRREPNKGQ